MALGDRDPDQHQYDRWLRRVRRAEGIPDLMGDVEAWQVIVDRMVESSELASVPDESAVLEGILEAVLDHFADGAFDFLLLELDEISSSAHARRTVLVRDLIRTAPGAPEGGSGYTPETEAAPTATTLQLLHRVVAHVDRWPFETADHYYFALT